MTYYHRTEAAARDAADKFAGHFDIKIELEPYNGWVIVLIPVSIDVFKWPLAQLLEEAEIDLTKWYRLRRRPEGYRPPPSVAEGSRVGRSTAPPPPAPPAPRAAAAPPPPPPPPPTPASADR